MAQSLQQPNLVATGNEQEQPGPANGSRARELQNVCKTQPGGEDGLLPAVESMNDARCGCLAGKSSISCSFLFRPRQAVLGSGNHAVSQRERNTWSESLRKRGKDSFSRFTC